MGFPSKLYKYQAYSSYALENLISKGIWISKPKDFNDPFDGKVRASGGEDIDKINALHEAYSVRLRNTLDPEKKNPFLSAVWKHDLGSAFYEEEPEEQQKFISRWAEQAVDLATSHIGVYSLTSQHADLLMWAHYADHHKGFVITFDTSQLETNDQMLVAEVVYGVDYPMLDFSDLIDTKPMPDYLKLIATRKSSQWENEKEWRLIFPYSNLLKPMPMPPIEIIFGHRMKESHCETLYKVVSANFEEVKFFTAVLSDAQYALDFVTYER